MKVLIVAKTHMTGAACVGGLTATNQNVRLLQPGCLNQPIDTPYEVGDIWELEFLPRLDVVSPHVEDVVVYRKSLVIDLRLANGTGHSANLA